jgi:hypothetical protein
MELLCLIYEIATDAARLDFLRIDQIDQDNPQVIQLVEQVEHDIDALVIDTHYVGKIDDQPGACNIDIAKHGAPLLNGRQ